MEAPAEGRPPAVNDANGPEDDMPDLEATAPRARPTIPSDYQVTVTN